jgi:Lon-like protease
MMTEPTPPSPPPSAPDPPDSGAGAPGAPAHKRRWPVVALSITLVVAAIVVTAMAFIRLPYVIISPGDATALDQHVVSVTGARTYPHKGKLVYLTVRVTNSDPNVWRWIFAKLDSDVSVEKRQDVIGCATYGDSASLQDDLMGQSQDAAKKVALTRLGYDIPESSASTAILDVQCNGPSDGKLHVGDRIVAVDSVPVSTADQVGPLIQKHKPGQTVRVSVQRDGKPMDVSVKLGRRDGTAILGIVSQTLFDWRFPIDVKIDTQRVTGPSGGLAFTLAIIDDLTPGDLTGGHTVAVTGAIAADGSVQPVGGVEQKAVTAREHGATMMLVPVGEAAAAKQHAGHMKVVPVRTIDDALRALERAGGAGVPPAPTTASTTPTPQ